MKKFPKLRSLKQGTKFIGYGANDVKMVCIAGTKRGPSRDITIEGREGTYSQRSDDTVELIETK